jgi:hypothetical protein
MKTYGLVIALVLSVLVNATFAGIVGYRWLASRGGEPSAGTPFGEGGGQGGKSVFPCEKIARLAGMKEEIRAEQQQVKEKIRGLRKQLFAEARKDDPDMAKVESLIDQISDQQKQLQKSIVKKLVAQRKTLTPEQKEVFDRAVKATFLKKGGMGMGMGMGKGKGKGRQTW